MKKNILIIFNLSFINISGAEDIKTGNARGFLNDTLDDWKLEHNLGPSREGINIRDKGRNITSYDKNSGSKTNKLLLQKKNGQLKHALSLFNLKKNAKNSKTTYVRLNDKKMPTSITKCKMVIIFLHKSSLFL